MSGATGPERIPMHIEPETPYDPIALGLSSDAIALLRWFEYSHLPPHLQAIAEPFRDLAVNLAVALRDGGGQVIAGLGKLLEAKDCMVRAAVLTSDAAWPTSTGHYRNER